MDLCYRTTPKIGNAADKSLLRAFAIVLVVVGSVPIILVRPQFGVLMWFWVSLMNLQQYTWGFSQEIRPALVVGLATIVAWLASQERKIPPRSATTLFLAALTFWMTVAAIFAIHPVVSTPYWEEYSKILLMTFVTMCIVTSRDRINQLVWIVVISIGYYGVKGGIFTIVTGGHNRVWGPPDSFIEDNNALACALIMILPLMNYLRTNTQNRWVRYGLTGGMGLIVISILGSYSRGALLGLIAMLGFLGLKARHRIATAFITLGFFGAALLFLPQGWYERMYSIDQYQTDDSAQGRLDAWRFNWRLALDRPLTGGGFEIGTDAPLFKYYVPTAPINRAAHSIYFQVLGETGFVGLGLYLMLLLASYRAASGILRRTRDRPDLGWARSLASMVQVSIVGYCVGGAFLSLGFYDLYYAVVAIITVTEYVVRRSEGPAEALTLRGSTADTDIPTTSPASVPRLTGASFTRGSPNRI